jgi:glutamine amidotransferase-like uncharacterized protein
MKYQPVIRILLLLIALVSITDGQTRKIRVAIYDDTGGGGAGTGNVERCLADTTAFLTRRVDAGDIRAGILKMFDVVVQAGGRGSKQAATLGVDGVDSIRQFVKEGGGYLGICAGAYLSTVQYPWSLGILNAEVLDREHWNRGEGEVRIRLTGAGRNFFGMKDTGSFIIRYGQGPLLFQADKPELMPYTELAVYETEIAENGAPEGMMIGATAIGTGEYGEGRVIAVSPHPEKSENLHHMVVTMVRWLAESREAHAVK